MSFIRTGLAVAALAGVTLLGATAYGQPPGGGGRFGGFGGGGTSGLDLLRNDDVRKELELVDDQIEKLEALEARQREESQRLFGGGGGGGGFRNLSAEEREKRTAEMRESMQKLQEEMQKEIDGILLPQQSKRLKQLVAQRRLQGFGGNLVSVDALATELELSDAQKAELQEKSEALQKELREEIAKLQKQARSELFEVLTPAQRAQLEEMMGEPFEFRQGGFGGGAFGGGRTGGPGARTRGGNRGGNNQDP
jgi:Spy/CpxP family protein refolding chaperone